MKREKFLSAIGNVKEEYIEEAMEFQASETSKPSRRPLWIRYGSLAACFLVALTVWLVYESRPQEKTEIKEPVTVEGTEKPELINGLPILDLEIGRRGGGAGLICIRGDGYLPDHNPWNLDWEPETLPVYKNTAFVNTAGQSVSVSKDELTKELKETAAALGVKAEADDIRYVQEDEDEQKNLACEAEIDNGEILLRVSSTRETYLVFRNELQLPDEYTVPCREMTEETAKAVTSYLLDEFQEITGLTDPVICVSKKYYGYDDGRPTWELMAYENSSDPTQKLLNYSMRNVSFELTENGTLNRVWVKHDLAGREKLGDYPVISLSEAEQLLACGQFMTRGGYDRIPDESEIEKTELVYLSGCLFNHFMPYYAFTARLPEEDAAEYYKDENGKPLRVYCEYYVPAVESKYLKNFLEISGE